MCPASSTLALCLMAVAAADEMCSHGPGGTCSSVDAADRGHALLQQKRNSQQMDEFMSGELVDEHAVNVEMNTKIVHNIPVYGYHRALHADQPSGEELLALEANDPVVWLVKLPDSFIGEKLHSFCSELAGNAQCLFTGSALAIDEIKATKAELDEILAKHPEVEFAEADSTLAIDEIKATKAELDEILAKHPEVEFAEADSKMYPDTELPVMMTERRESETSNANVPWGLDRIDERQRTTTRDYIPSPKKGTGVHVYVLDTGVRTTHQEFQGRAIPTLESYKTVFKVCDSKDTTCASDGNGHGTHCAGTIAGHTFGVAPNATIHAVQVFDKNGSGGQTSTTVQAMDWIISNGLKPAVISMSLGGPRNGKSYEIAVNRAVASGITVVVSAGNDNFDACSKQPAYVNAAITVGATDSDDDRSDFSNYGTCVDIFAPGGSIKSASHQGDTWSTTKSGTSMACPHVAGAAALILSQDPEMSPGNVTANLIAKATTGTIAKLPPYPVSPNLLLYVDQSSPELFLTMPSSAPTPPIANITCGFESDLDPFCSTWSHWPSPQFRWWRHRGSTPSAGTGPSGAANGSYYLYFEASSRQEGQGTGLWTLTNARYLALYLHMYGATMGTFKVWTCSWKDGQCVDSWVVRREESGNKGDVWRHVIVDLGPGDKRVALQVKRGSGWQSDIAMDSLTLVMETPAPTMSP